MSAASLPIAQAILRQNLRQLAAAAQFLHTLIELLGQLAAVFQLGAEGDIQRRPFAAAGQHHLVFQLPLGDDMPHHAIVLDDAVQAAQREIDRIDFARTVAGLHMDLAFVSSLISSRQTLKGCWFMYGITEHNYFLNILLTTQKNGKPSIGLSPQCFRDLI